MNSIHDVGGMDGFGPVKREENEPVFHEPWEGRMRAIHTLVSKKHKFYNIDESRHAIERMNPVYYLGSSYYQIWLLRMEHLLVERGVLTEAEIKEKMAQLSPLSYSAHLQPYRNISSHIPSSQRNFALTAATGSGQKDESIQPKFSPGTPVRVKVMSPLGHTRAPRYVRGKQGVIEEIHGNFILPDLRVHEGINHYQPVYRVRFHAQDLWGEEASPNDKLFIEMWEDYLELGGAKNEES